MNFIEDKRRDLPLKSGLYLVSLPIGNREDVTLRALNVLRQVDIIACEDTRHTKPLLAHYGISAKTMAYHEYSKPHVEETLIELLQTKAIALVSDAGTPLISDPGYKLVKKCQEHNIYVTSIPGANAILPALQLSGFIPYPFSFLGFVPEKTKAREAFFSLWQNSASALVFFVPPHDLLKVVGWLKPYFSQRKIAIIREITKLFEETIHADWQEIENILIARQTIKGEIVVVLSAPEAGLDDIDYEKLEAAIIESLHKNIPLKTLARDIANQFQCSKNMVYERALHYKQEKKI